MPQPYVLFDNVCKYYQMGDTRIAASDHVSFEIQKGEFCVILGPSGAGKTTVLNMLGGMDTCDEGTILLDGEKVSGFDKKRLFYTQGDYGLWQCSRACHNKTYDNEDTVRQMIDQQQDMEIPSELIPRCPVCGAPMIMNLRCDDTFVQDEGWYAARNQYSDFVRRHKHGTVLYLELGVGNNTPVIIKYPFWKYTLENPDAVYACVNFGQAYAPREIAERSVCLDADIGRILSALKRKAIS